jgi:hypothetical protein
MEESSATAKTVGVFYCDAAANLQRAHTKTKADGSREQQQEAMTIVAKVTGF